MHSLERAAEKIEKYLRKRKIAKLIKYLEKNVEMKHRIAILAQELARKIKNVEKDSHAEKDFMLAAKDGDLENIVIGLLDGADVDTEDKWGSALFVASFNYNYRIAELLIRLGADVNASDSHKETVLMNAAIGDNIDLVRLLLKKGANPFAKNDRQRSAKMKAKAQERKLSNFITREIITLLETHEKGLLQAYESSQGGAEAGEGGDAMPGMAEALAEQKGDQQPQEDK